MNLKLTDSEIEDGWTFKVEYKGTYACFYSFHSAALTYARQLNEFSAIAPKFYVNFNYTWIELTAL